MKLEEACERAWSQIDRRLHEIRGSRRGRSDGDDYFGPILQLWQWWIR